MDGWLGITVTVVTFYRVIMIYLDYIRRTCFRDASVGGGYKGARYAIDRDGVVVARQRDKSRAEKECRSSFDSK